MSLFAISSVIPSSLASGLKLNRDLAENALNSVGSKINLSAFDTAKGILKISSANMADAIREITIEQGIDPRELKLLAFGGAGPLMSNLIAKELDIKEIIIPPFSGNFSAWGLLGADLLQMTAQTKILRLNEKSINECNQILERLFEDLQERQKINFEILETIKEISLDMRWMGQEHTITLKLNNEKLGKITSSEDDIKKMFVSEYEKTFGSKLDTIIEIVSIRASLRVPLPRKTSRGLINEELSGSDQESIKCYSFDSDSIEEFKIIQRNKIEEEFSGPAIILESTAVTYVDKNYTVKKDNSDHLIITDTKI